VWVAGPAPAKLGSSIAQPQRWNALVAAPRGEQGEAVVRLQKLGELGEKRYTFGDRQWRALGVVEGVVGRIGSDVQRVGASIYIEKQIRLPFGQVDLWNGCEVRRRLWVEAFYSTLAAPLNQRQSGRCFGMNGVDHKHEGAYFSPSWTAFQADRGRDFSVIVDGVSG
jgi:hypothetical protein